MYAHSCLDSKEFACNAGDPGSIPGSGRSPGDLKLTSLRDVLTDINGQLLVNLFFLFFFVFPSIVAQPVRSVPAFISFFLW